MSLADIDRAATQRRIQEIADTARKSFEAHAQRSAQLDAAAREAVAKEDADVEAVKARNAEREARKAEQARGATRQQPRKPATLSLGADEFKLDRQARQAAGELPSPGPREPATRKPGLRQDEPAANRKKPRPGGDDDMSGRTWLR
ncbi:hypothetical protein [Actinophytocola oryzae]|uniref:Uncharacterized protein n=1 Tax=Actinophytocola oryzae TaxID=502181 RepID=A0A4R7VDQ7_9PSEU|nr:hypothetical protein [Actinophytocola oryzae]TDV47177.1 hypothetical protein CLV71_110361 [Actinophytocola oryzae]